MWAGRLRQRSFETREGEKRTVVEMEVDEVGPSLKYATAKVNRTQRGSSSGGGFGSPRRACRVRRRRGHQQRRQRRWRVRRPVGLRASGRRRRLLRRTPLLTAFNPI